MGIKVFVDNVEFTSLRVSKEVAAKLLDCSIEEFENLYIQEGLIWYTWFDEEKEKIWVEDIIALRKKILDMRQNEKEKLDKNNIIPQKTVSKPKVILEELKETVIFNKRKRQPTKRMLEVHELVKKNYKSKEIAKILGISVGNVIGLRSKYKQRMKFCKNDLREC